MKMLFILRDAGRTVCSGIEVYVVAEDIAPALKKYKEERIGYLKKHDLKNEN